MFLFVLRFFLCSYACAFFNQVFARAILLMKLKAANSAQTRTCVCPNLNQTNAAAGVGTQDNTQCRGTGVDVHVCSFMFARHVRVDEIWMRTVLWYESAFGRTLMWLIAGVGEARRCARLPWTHVVVRCPLDCVELEEHMDNEDEGNLFKLTVAFGAMFWLRFVALARKCKQRRVHNSPQSRVGSSSIKRSRIMSRRSLIEDLQKLFKESQWVGSAIVEDWVAASSCLCERVFSYVRATNFGQNTERMCEVPWVRCNGQAVGAFGGF